MANQRFETDWLLAWLGELLRHSEAVDVDITVVDGPPGGSSLQIIIHDVPEPLAGLKVKEVAARRGDGGGFSLDGGPSP